MPDLGAVAYLIAISYGMGVLWYTILGRNYTSWMRMAAFPLLGMIIGEAVWINHLAANAQQGLVFLGVHIYVALAATFIGALVDIGASWLAKEHPVSHALELGLWFGKFSCQLTRDAPIASVASPISRFQALQAQFYPLFLGWKLPRLNAAGLRRLLRVNFPRTTPLCIH